MPYLESVAKKFVVGFFQHFKLHFALPAADGYDVTTKLESLMLESLVEQTHTLWDSVKCRDEIGVLRPTCSQKGKERENDAN